MKDFELGLVLPMLEDPTSGVAPRWDRIRSTAIRAEAMGFDTVWVADELLWRAPDWPGPRGWWECVSMAGAVAASTTTIGVGTWVLSALHRNPGLTVKAAETLDEISGGRFILGYGAGHAGDQGATFGYPADVTVSRYEEALAIVVPALRGEAVTFDGRHHRSSDLDIRPRGPRQGAIPLMLGAHGERTMRIAARHADIWSAFATESSHPEWFVPMLERLDAACGDVGRDPTTLDRSIGVFVEPGTPARAEALGFGTPISGGTDEIATSLRRFSELGVDRVEIVLWPGDESSLDAIEPVVDLVASGPAG